MVTIENLEVQFDVTHDGDEKVSKKHSTTILEEQAQAQEQEQMLQRRLRQDQMLGDDQTRSDF